MKRYLIFLIAAGLLGIFACSKKDNLLTFKLDTPFTIGYQEKVSWEEDDNVNVQFNRVLADSRCPIDAICVWAGRVEVEITFSQPGSTETKVVALGDMTNSDYSDTATFGDYSVKLLHVAPDALSDVVIPQSAYKPRLEVHKVP